MKSILIFTLTFLFLALQVSAYDFYAPLSSSPPDSIPPPPPDGPVVLTGPSFVCVGDTSEFIVEVPVSCSCQWYINDLLQPQTTPELVIAWTEPGEYEVSVIFQCTGGQFSDPQTILMDVLDTPQPQPISGDTYVCEYTYHTYSTVVGPSDSCEWTVNGDLQPGYAPSINYAFGEAGTYLFEVVAYNPCGTSSPQTLEVIAQGTAPSTPSPIQGAGESCEGETEFYTTTVGPGESCSWWIDGELQASTETTLEVSWENWGDHVIEVRAVSDCGTGNPTFKNVQVLYQPFVFLGNDTTIIQGQSLLLDAGNHGSNYLWSTAETTQTIVVTTAGTYSVTVSSFCGSDIDSIEVSVYTGIEDVMNSSGCFLSRLNGKSIELLNLPAGTHTIQMISISGKVIYSGPPLSRITAPGPGILFIRVISPETSCYKKVFIP